MTKMANNTLVCSFSLGGGKLSRNGDESLGEYEENCDNNDITKAETIADERTDTQDGCVDVSPREGGSDGFLAGHRKNDNLMAVINDNEEIPIKDSDLSEECNDEAERNEDSEAEVIMDKDEKVPSPLYTRSLNKMHIMEDVREGCNVQPSSPGHAEQRTNKDIKSEAATENGLKCETLHTEIDLYNGLKDECKDSEPEPQESDNANSNCSSDENHKRKSESEGSPAKRLRAEIQENFAARDKIFSEFIELADCSSVEQIQGQTEQILCQIRALNEMAKEKEREWNNVIHLKKIKEELLLRMQRKKQVMLLSEQKGRQNGVDVGLVDFRQGKRPVIDVQSLIADYRQRHPEVVPRRGRRIRTLNNDSRNSIVNMALGSGAQVKHNPQAIDDLGMLLTSMGSNNLSRLSNDPSAKDNNSFKDMLVQLAQLSQNERNELLQNAIKPPPPYPEVTVHPVPTATSTPHTNSLLHGILTKSPQKTNSKTSFSPTLARLLTAPERANMNHAASPSMGNSTMLHPSNMSISEILSSNKARDEITITPVGNYEVPVKSKNEDEEVEDQADRLVIDESSEVVDGRRGGGDNSSDMGDEVPQCQGCNLKSAQFVCAGCGNQWYCSRDCQVSAWDEHSEICSG